MHTFGPNLRVSSVDCFLNYYKARLLEHFFLKRVIFVLPVDSVLGRRLTRGDCDLGDIRGLSNCKEGKVNASLNPISLFSKWVSKEVVGK